MMMAVVALPMSAARRSGSRLVRELHRLAVRATTELMDSEKDSRVRVTACFMRSKKPRFSSWGGGSVCGLVGFWCAFAEEGEGMLTSLAMSGRWLFVAAWAGHEVADGIPGLLFR